MIRGLIRRRLWTTVGVVLPLLGLAVWAGAAEAAPDQPNVVLIVADDLGYSDVGFQGSGDIRTPNIDALAASGVIMRQGYSSASTCSPSRAGYMTGKYQQRFGHENNPPSTAPDPDIGLPVDQVTLGDMFKQAGYATATIGKWHLGTAPEYHPNVRGFDYFFGTLATPKSYFDPKPESVNKLQRNGVAVPLNGYLTDVFAADAVEFIENNRDRPFFLHMAFNAPHIPYEVTTKYLDRYPDLTGDRQLYAAMVSALDDGVGRILAEIDTLTRPTVVVFISDNGGAVGIGATNAPLRDSKGSTWEGGIRVPFVMRIPGIDPKVYHRPVVTRDFMPTFAALAGTAPPADLDGVNLLPYLSGDDTGYPHDYLFWRMRGSVANAARNITTKTVEPASGGRLTFAIKDDPEEQYPIADDPQLISAYEEWAAEMIPPKW
ncbi:MAG: sulfatase-like hydrolase/transferase [Rhodospirillales bacterium]